MLEKLCWGPGGGKRAEAHPHLNSDRSLEIDPEGVGKGGHCHYQAGHCHLGGHLGGEAPGV